MNTFCAFGRVIATSPVKEKEGRSKIYFTMEIVNQDSGAAMRVKCFAYGGLAQQASSLKIDDWVLGSGKLAPSIYNSNPTVSFMLSGFLLLTPHTASSLNAPRDLNILAEPETDETPIQKY
jgi:hypothetical protein